MDNLNAASMDASCSKNMQDMTPFRMKDCLSLFLLGYKFFIVESDNSQRGEGITLILIKLQNIFFVSPLKVLKLEHLFNFINRAMIKLVIIIQQKVELVIDKINDFIDFFEILRRF